MTDKKLIETASHSEAPRSATINVKTEKGFYVMFTMREETGKELIEDIEAFETVVLAKGWSPVEPRSGGNFPKKPDVPTKPCPIHNEPMKERISKKDGSKYFSHSRGQYPNLQWCNGSGFPGEQKLGVGDEPPTRDVNEGDYF